MDRDGARCPEHLLQALGGSMHEGEEEAGTGGGRERSETEHRALTGDCPVGRTIIIKPK